MLQINKDHAQRRNNSKSEDTSVLDLFRSTIDLARRHLPMFIAICAACLVLGILYLLTTAPRYTAVATMVIDVKKVQLFQQQGGGAAELPVDAGTVQTQVELIKSQNVSLAVIKDLHLTDDPEFVASKAGLLGSVLGLVGSVFGNHEPPSEAALQRRALGVFEADRTVTRLGQTYVMEISFRSLDPTKAARIANAIVDAYVNDQLEAKYNATRRASVWLQDRIRELRAQTTAADQAVVSFKNSNNIVDTGGKLMNEQQVGEVNTQLILAEATTAEAKARLDRIAEVMKQPIPDPSISDALKNEVIIKLRQSYLDLAGREAIWAVKYGPNHLATISLRNQMLELRRNISDEMRKIAQSYESDYQIARARENSIRTSLSTSVSKSQSTSQAQIQLRSLESTSTSYKSMYDILLQRYMEAVQQQSFPISEARLISPASPPFGPSQPKKPVVFAATIMAALMLSFGAAFAREFFDQVFRSGKQIEERLGINSLATLPSIKAETVPVFKLPPTSASVRDIGIVNPLLRYVVGMPFAQFTEALRSVKVAVDIGAAGKAGRIIGVTSTLPNEGKSTIATNFAQMISHAGGRVLLVDGDLRNPSLTRSLASGMKGGLIDVVGGKKTLADVVWTDRTSGLHLLPVGGPEKLMHTNEVLGSEKMAEFFKQLQGHYDYIVVDCAPLAPVVDTRTTVNFIDSYLFVIEWGTTKIDVIEHTLQEAPEVYDRLIGAVINKANMEVMGRYELHRSNKYYRKYYMKYGYTQ